MKIGDMVEVVKDNHSPGYFIGLKGKVTKIKNTDEEYPGMNVGIIFREEDNKGYEYNFNMIKNIVLYFDEDELNNIEG